MASSCQVSQVTLPFKLFKKIIFNIINFLGMEDGAVLHGLAMQLYFTLVVFEKAKV